MWILIITLAFSNMQSVYNGGAGAGGAAIAKDAGHRWENSISKYEPEIKDAAKWICVKK